MKIDRHYQKVLSANQMLTRIENVLAGQKGGDEIVVSTALPRLLQRVNMDELLNPPVDGVRLKGKTVWRSNIGRLPIEGRNMVDFAKFTDSVRALK